MLNWCLPWEGTNKSSHSIHIILDSWPPSWKNFIFFLQKSCRVPEILNSALKLSEIRFNCKASVRDSANKLRIRFMHELVLSLLIFFCGKKILFCVEQVSLLRAEKSVCLRYFIRYAAFSNFKKVLKKWCYIHAKSSIRFPPDIDILVRA